MLIQVYPISSLSFDQSKQSDYPDGKVTTAVLLLHEAVAIGNPERHVRKASHRGSKQQQRSCSQSLSLLLAHATYIMVLFFTHIPFVVNHTINATPPERLQQGKIDNSLLNFGNAKRLSILPHEAKALLQLFCLQPIRFGWKQNSFSGAFASWSKIKIHYFTWGGSGLDRTDHFQKFCGSGLDRIQFYRIRTGLGLKNFTVRSSLVWWLLAPSISLWV